MLILVYCSQLPQIDYIPLLVNPIEKPSIYSQVQPKKPSFFESIINKIIKPKARKTTATSKKTKKKPVKIKYKKYVMAEGEGLWQVADKKKIAIKDVPEWIELIAKKNKMNLKDNQDNYVLNAGDTIWIPM
jgi:hypothetical protein